MASSVSKGIWSNFAKRSQSLAIKNKGLKDTLLSPTLPYGPYSLKKRSSKMKYTSPIGLEDIYPLAYNYLETKSEKIYKEIESIKKQIDESSNEEEKLNLKQKHDDLLVAAEIDNPEVIYNANYATNSIDRTQPVYRHFLEEKWKSYARMLIMQRLETLSIIPDSLPTLDPQVDVKLKFPYNNIETFIEPGTILSSNVTSKPPALEIIEFKESKDDLYTLLVVDLDQPDLEHDSFKTTLQWGLQNVKLSNEDCVIDAKKLTEHPEYEFMDYLPPVPEKNTGKHRLAVWVFRQDKTLDAGEVNRDDFDIRAFVEKNELVPIGAHAWRSAWDRNTENVRSLYGLPKGRIFSRFRSGE